MQYEGWKLNDVHLIADADATRDDPSIRISNQSFKSVITRLRFGQSPRDISIFPRVTYFGFYVVIFFIFSASD